LRRLYPVAGSTGDLFPHLFIDLVRILLDRKILAAHRAAKSHRSSTDPEFNFLAAELAFHGDLKSGTKVSSQRAQKKLRTMEIH
jgi:hypothetical protein